MHSLTIDDIINELDLGRATVKFILNRFSDMLPHHRVNGRSCYKQDALSTLIQIKDLMDQGLVPSQIETALAQTPSPAAARENPIEDVRMSQDALAFIQGLFQDIKVHQSRIAQAHEKRAEAEERKAVAIEKRAEAEEKKAQAMNNIAAALQDMSRQRSGDSQAMEIAGHAAQALTMTETQDLSLDQDLSMDEDTIDLDAGLDDADLNDLFSPPGPGTELKGDAGFDDLELDEFESDDLGLEDLAREISEPDADTPATDDLNLLVDKISTPGEEGLDSLLDDPGPLPDLEDLVDTDQQVEDLDDLSRLLDMPETVQAKNESEESTPLDDLSLLVEHAEDKGLAPEPPADLDDLSALVDTGHQADLDDLNLLVDHTGSDLPDADPPNSDPSQPKDLDDLSLLVASPAHDDPKNEDPKDMDDLSALVDTPSLDDLSALVNTTPPTAPDDLEDLDDLFALVDKDSQPKDMDDLSALFDTQAPAEPEPSLKPEITPEQDMAKYKAAVMKIIIELKDKGLSAGETTDRLNRDEVPTLSGKPLWREKAIGKIYGFIESAK